MVSLSTVVALRVAAAAGCCVTIALLLVLFVFFTAALASHLARDRAATAVRITAFVTTLLIANVQRQVTFVFKEHVVNQMQGGQHGCLFLDIHVLFDVHGKVVGICGQFLGDLR